MGARRCIPEKGGRSGYVECVMRHSMNQRMLQCLRVASMQGNGEPGRSSQT